MKSPIQGLFSHVYDSFLSLHPLIIISTDGYWSIVAILIMMSYRLAQRCCDIGLHIYEVLLRRFKNVDVYISYILKRNCDIILKPYIKLYPHLQTFPSYRMSRCANEDVLLCYDSEIFLQNQSCSGARKPLLKATEWLCDRTRLTSEISITLTFRVQRKCCQGWVCETDF